MQCGHVIKNIETSLVKNDKIFPKCQICPLIFDEFNNIPNNMTSKLSIC